MLPAYLKGSRKEGKKFVNVIPTAAGSLAKMPSILWAYLNNKEESTPKNQLGPFVTDPSVFQTPPASGLRVTWMGHSSLLIEIDGKILLTDPVWSDRASFSKSLGPKRFFAPPLALDQLPPLDAVIISHDHYDHLDRDTIKFFANKPVHFYCSLGVGQYLEKWGIHRERITEMDWGDTATIGNDMTLTSAPARHFSGRGMFNRNETLWASFVIQGNYHKIFYGADSGWFDGFAAIGEAYGPFDLTMLEIGASDRHWADIHMGPVNAANAHLALKGNVMMPIHWGTFNLALHAWYDPIERLVPLTERDHITLFAPEPGKPTEVTLQGYNSEWWKSFR